MTDDVTRRPWWRWMAGMVDDCGARVVGVDGPWALVTSGVHGADVYMALASSLRPNTTDPATLGCLLALARELAGDATAGTWWSDCDEVWYVRAGPAYMTSSGPTEWSALVAACDAAWGRR